jgi:hypothetical protein
MNCLQTILITVALGAASLLPGTAAAVTPAQEKAFIDAYRTAYVNKDSKALQAMLYTEGADPMALEFYKMMISADTGATITSITLVDLSADDRKKLETGKSPDGRPMKMTLKPVKKLVLKTSTKSASGSSTGSSESFVAEHQGKLVIPVPGVAK